MTSEIEEKAQQYEELLEFVYLSPFALARIDETGAIDMMNSMGANLLLEFAPTPEISNLLDILDAVDPGVRKLIAEYPEERGPICEGRRISIEAFGGGDPIVLSLNLLKLKPGRIMAAFGDVSKLEAAHRAQRFLLDNVSDGLVTVDATGHMSGQCSAMLARWLGAPTEGLEVWTYVAVKAPRFAVELQLGWETMMDDFLPLELCLQQLPKRLDVDGVPLGVTYQPLMNGEKLAHVLVVMRDLTAQLERERLDSEQRELMAAVSRLSIDREGFRGYVDDSTELVRALTTEGEGLDKITSSRLLHTLKGNSALFGIASIAQMAHHIEDRISGAPGGDWLNERERAQLKDRWAHLAEGFRTLLGEANTAAIAPTRAEFVELYEMINQHAPSEAVLEKLEQLALAPVHPQLTRYAQQAVALGERLEKAPIATHVDSGGVRHHIRSFAPFWSAFVHAVRNAVDHGIETAEERLAANKPESATIELVARATPQHITVELRDDGRGVDWARLAAKAAKHGLPSASHEDLVNAMFSDGVSSRDEVTETSGRGVGLGALKHACLQLGGTIEVESRPGLGTTFRFRFPRASLGRPTMLPPMQHAA